MSVNTYDMRFYIEIEPCANVIDKWQTVQLNTRLSREKLEKFVIRDDSKKEIRESIS